MNLEPQDIDRIAYKTALIVVKKLTKQRDKDYPELVTTEEAAAILHITPQRMRQIKDKYPYIKRGEGKQGKLLFKRDALFLSI